MLHWAEVQVVTGFRSVARLMRVGRHVVERWRHPSEAAVVLKVCHDPNIFHHCSVVRMRCASKTAT